MSYEDESRSCRRDADFAEMLRKEQFDDLVFAALAMGDNISDFAARCFRRIFYLVPSIFVVSDAAQAAIKEAADGGNPHARFAYGRLLRTKNWNAGDVETALEYFEKAYAQHLSDAGAAIANAYYAGEYGLVDYSRAKQYLVEALEQSSEFAAVLYINWLNRGTYGFNLDTALAIKTSSAIIENEDLEGMPSAIWKSLRGVAYYREGNVEAACQDLEAAANNGIIDAWSFLALFKCTDPETGEYTDVDEYERLLNEGIDHHCGDCLMLSNEPFVTMFDSLDEDTRERITGSVLQDFDRAVELGSAEAAKLLGDIYRDGLCGQPEDINKAWSYYARAALWRYAQAYESMFDMAVKGIVKQEQDSCDLLALNGARYGSQELIIETVAAYYAGRLTAFASEIEQYYVPVYQAHEEDESDDDGRYDAWS